MKKTFVMISAMFLMGAAVTHCGGGEDAAKDPSTAKTEFTSPAGTITAENATEVMNNTLNAANGEALQGLPGMGNLPGYSRLALEKGLRHFKPNFRLQSGAGACFEQVGSTGVSMDFECMADNGYLDDCTASGKLLYELAGEVMTVTYDNISIVCESDGTNVTALNGKLLVLFDAPLPTTAGATTYPNALILCVDASAMIDGVLETAAGCIGLSGEYIGHYLVDGEGGSVVVNSVNLNTDKTKVCAEFTMTGDATVSITCDVAAPTSPSQWDDIEEVANCTFAEAPCAEEFTL